MSAGATVRQLMDVPRSATTGEVVGTIIGAVIGHAVTAALKTVGVLIVLECWGVI